MRKQLDALLQPVGCRSKLADEVLHDATIGTEQLEHVAAPNEQHLVPYRKGHIVNMDVANDATFKLALLSFDAGTGLSPHGAPGDALLLALDGEATIDYEDVKYPIRARQAFKFDAGGRHAVRADKPFKMALLVTLSA